MDDELMHQCFCSVKRDNDCFFSCTSCYQVHQLVVCSCLMVFHSVSIGIWLFFFFLVKTNIPGNIEHVRDECGVRSRQLKVHAIISAVNRQRDQEAFLWSIVMVFVLVFVVLDFVCRLIRRES